MVDRATVLVLDGDKRSREDLWRILGDEFDVQAAVRISEAEEILRREWVQVVLCDQLLPDGSGVDFLGRVREEWPEVVRMIISGQARTEDVIDSVNEAGIYQYITKPWHPDTLLLTVRNAVRLFRLQRENDLLSLELKLSPEKAERNVAAKRAALRRKRRADDGIVRKPGSPMSAICETLRTVAPFDVSVLITGESGTGKELCARALHYNGLRGDGPFVVENCGAVPDELLESELFGYKKGAFTGAYTDRTGLFEQASGGTIFLDEIGDVSPAFQVKLLRVLQEGEIRPLGSNQRRKVDVRVIAATNRDLQRDVRTGRFRKDLYYRLSAVEIHVPPLRRREGDVTLIARALLHKAVQSLRKNVVGFTDEALACMEAYPWPGNVRELQNEVQRMVVFGREGAVLGAELLSPRVLHGIESESEPEQIESFDDTDVPLKNRLEALEGRILRETLIRHRWNKSRAASELGISRVGLRAKIERFGLGPLKH